jgi:hypothetical protein
MCDVAGLNFGCGYGKRADVGDVVVDRIPAVEEVEELNEEAQGEAFTELEIAAYPKIHLRKRHTAKLVKRGLLAVDHGAVNRTPFPCPRFYQCTSLATYLEVAAAASQVARCPDSTNKVIQAVPKAPDGVCNLSVLIRWIGEADEGAVFQIHTVHTISAKRAVNQNFFVTPDADVIKSKQLQGFHSLASH